MDKIETGTRYGRDDRELQTPEGQGVIASKKWEGQEKFIGKSSPS